MTDEITFLICNRVGLYSALPVIAKVTRQGARVVLVCREPVRVLAKQVLPDPSVSLVALEPIEAEHRWAHYLHSMLLQTFTDLRFSKHYRDLRTNLAARDGDKWRSAVLKLSRVAPSWPSDEVNHRLFEHVSRVLMNPFPTRRIVAVSQADVPHLLCARSQEVITLMESWDHPFKSPAGYSSALVIPWNRDLGADWTHFQGDSNLVIGFPLKLRYALERAAPTIDLERANGEKVAMYAACTSSLDYPGYRRWFLDELKLIRDVARATQRAGWRLLIKPKPNGFAGEFDELSSEFSHVGVGAYGGSSSRSSVINYYLDDEYNSARLAELASCDIVINYGTTFALDAAAANRPVLQLDARGSHCYPEVANALKRYHLERYFLGDPELTMRVSDGLLVEQLAGFLDRIDSRPARMTRWIRAWLTEECSDAAIDRIARAVTQ